MAQVTLALIVNQRSCHYICISWQSWLLFMFMYQFLLFSSWYLLDTDVFPAPYKPRWSIHHFGNAAVYSYLSLCLSPVLAEPTPISVLRLTYRLTDLLITNSQLITLTLCPLSTALILICCSIYPVMLWCELSRLVIYSDELPET